ncbi:MAG: ribbon-helix-helix protein, CopG family [Phycisphaerae bacterium]|nr:ribbon-helix-helix protein, CopG family [Phycisphaerae bacterium]
MMVRSQIYLSEKARDGLRRLAKTTGKKRADLIREAIDEKIERSSDAHRLAVLKAAAGMWKDRTDLPDFKKLRAEWDRR